MPREPEEEFRRASGRPPGLRDNRTSLASYGVHFCRILHPEKEQKAKVSHRLPRRQQAHRMPPMAHDEHGRDKGEDPAILALFL